ncbi:RNA-directed DNA polymerase, eukaryota, reverse transcriptase zinc-binding domain protein [Tanacetum coccineum]
MVQWIVSYVTTTSFSINVNRESFGYFKGGRGLRQRDLIFPYLFTLVMEIISLIVQDKVEKRKEFKYHFGCQKMKLTHVCFADDLLIFCNRDKGFVSVLKDVIEEFGSVSGLLPNYNKSTIIFKSMKEEDKQEILDCVPFKVEKLSVRYLGVPLNSKRIGEDYTSLHMSLNPSMCELAQGKAKVAWKNFCKPKSQELSMGEIHIIKLKGRSIWAVNEEVYDSCGWKNILRIIEEVKKFLVIKVENKEKTSMIYDNWCNVGILQSFLTNRDIYNARVNPEIVVKDLIDNGSCNWPEEWIEKWLILSQYQKINLDESKNDVLVWRNKKGNEGKFTVKQAYEDLRSNGDELKWCKTGMAKQKLGVMYLELEWNDLVDMIDGMYIGNSIESVIRRLGLAANVYLIWQERNCILFKGEKRRPNELAEVFYEIIRMRLMSLKTPIKGCLAILSKDRIAVHSKIVPCRAIFEKLLDWLGRYGNVVNKIWFWCIKGDLNVSKLVDSVWESIRYCGQILTEILYSCVRGVGTDYLDKYVVDADDDDDDDVAVIHRIRRK